MTMALLPRPQAALEAVPPADRHPAAVYLAQLAPGSRRAMLQALDVCAQIISSGHHNSRTLPWHELRFQHTQAIRSVLAEKYAPAGANKMLAALRGTLKACWRLGLVSAEDYHRAADLAGVRGSRLLRGRALEAGELRALFQTCANDPRPQGRRDAALIAIGYGAGLRRAELTALDLEDCDLEAGTLRVRGKGNRERIAHINGGTTAALREWLEVRGQDAGALFYAINKGGTIQPTRASSQLLWVALRARAKAAGLRAATSPHDLRRSFVGDALDAGVDLATVQQLAGHANVQTTARYDRRGELAKKAGAARLHVPFVSGNSANSVSRSDR
jgi:site-specific recombinase XerD